MDQEQTGPAAISRARLGEGADGDVVGLPHLQLAELHPTEETRARRKLKKAEKTNPPRSAKAIHKNTRADSSVENKMGFFTASQRTWGTLRHSILSREVPQ